MTLTNLLLTNCLFELSPMFVDEYLALVSLREVMFVVKNYRYFYINHVLLQLTKQLKELTRKADWKKNRHQICGVRLCSSLRDVQPKKCLSLVSLSSSPMVPDRTGFPICDRKTWQIDQLEHL